MNSKYSLLFSFAVLLNLNSCCARKQEKQINHHAAETTRTEATNEVSAPFGTVIDFADFVKEYGSEEAALRKITNTEKVVLDFYATWCPPCQQLAPNFASAAKQLPNVLCIKINAEQFNAISKQYFVRSFPTLVFLRNGVRVSTISGFRSQKALIDEIKSIFN